MGIFYLNEHTSCHYYDKHVTFGFQYYKLESGEKTLNEKPQNNYILFVLQGHVKLFCNEFAMELRSSEMVFIHRNSNFRFETFEPTQIVLAVFDSVTHLCVKMSLTELVDYKKKVAYEIKPFEIREKLRIFLYPLASFLKDGANCRQLHEIKLQELFWILRAYYLKEEMASFLYTIIGTSQDFRDKVLSNYRRVNSVQDLAQLCGMSLVTFKRQFIDEFHTNPHQWLQKRLTGLVRYKLADPDLSLKQITEELNFSSLPHFVRFCKKNLGQTPGEIRKQCGNDNTNKEG